MAMIASAADVNALPMLAVSRLNKSCMPNSTNAAIPENTPNLNPANAVAKSTKPNLYSGPASVTRACLQLVKP